MPALPLLPPAQEQFKRRLLVHIDKASARRKKKKNIDDEKIKKN